MNILVTGGCGFIGFHVAKYYKEQGHDVIVVDNLERSKLLGHDVKADRAKFNQKILEDMGILVFNDDISKKETFYNLPQPVNVIIHLAAQCGVPTSIENPRRDYEVNLTGTFNVLEFAKANDAKVVFASTNKVYPIHEAFIKKGHRWHFLNPEWETWGVPLVNGLVGSRTPYGWSKYSADQLCQEFYHTYGVKVGIFRMSCIYGPNQFGFEEQGWATWFAIATCKSRPITIYGDGCQVRDMLYVTDVVQAYDAFVQSDLDHGVFNLGGGPENSFSLNTCLDILEDLTGKRSSVEYQDWRPCDQKVYISDIRPVKIALDWTPKISVFEGMRDIVEWVKKNKEVF